MFKKILSLVALFALTSQIALAQGFSLSPGAAQQAVPQFSRCGSNSFAVSITSATTALISDGSVASLLGIGGHVCGFLIQIVSGTNPTFQLVTGTGTACGTGQANLTGAFAAAGVFTLGGLANQINVPAGKQLCIKTAGTGTPTFAGFVTYGYW